MPDIEVNEADDDDLSHLEAKISPELWRAWRRKAFNQKRLLAFQNGRCLGGVIVTEGVEPYTGLVQLSLKHFVELNGSKIDTTIAPFMSAVARTYEDREGWLSLTTESEEQVAQVRASGFCLVQVDFVLSLQGRRKRAVTTHIRNADSSDLSWIKALSALCLPYLVCNPPGYDKQLAVGYCREKWPTITQSIDLLDQRLAVLVALNERSERIAYAVLDFGLDEAWIHDFAVAPDHRGSVVARDLLTACETLCVELRYQKLRATATVENRRSWVAALRVGFDVFSRRWLYPLPLLV